MTDASPGSYFYEQKEVENSALLAGCAPVFLSLVRQLELCHDQVAGYGGGMVRPAVVRMMPGGRWQANDGRQWQVRDRRSRQQQRQINIAAVMLFTMRAASSTPRHIGSPRAICRCVPAPWDAFDARGEQGG